VRKRVRSRTRVDGGDSPDDEESEANDHLARQDRLAGLIGGWENDLVPSRHSGD